MPQHKTNERRWDWSREELDYAVTQLPGPGFTFRTKHIERIARAMTGEKGKGVGLRVRLLKERRITVAQYTGMGTASLYVRNPTPAPGPGGATRAHSTW